MLERCASCLSASYSSGEPLYQYPAEQVEQVGRFRAANRHFKQAGSIAEHYGFKAPFAGVLPGQIHLTSHPSYGHKLMFMAVCHARRGLV
jgi:hypothetical protein